MVKINSWQLASVKRIKNPINLQERFLKKPNMFLVGDGAESFAEMVGETIVDPSYFHSDKNLKRLKKAKSKLAKIILFKIKLGQ